MSKGYDFTWPLYDIVSCYSKQKLNFALVADETINDEVIKSLCLTVHILVIMLGMYVLYFCDVLVNVLV